ncbi:thiamine pyrophosphate-binding protein, partial [Kitasatospora sp. NPDC057542]
MSRNDEWTVARYLATRLEQLGIRHLFGVPGDFLGPFLTIMQATTTVRWIGT